MPWNVFINRTVDEQWGMLLDTIFTAQNELVLLKGKRTGNRNSPKWYSVEIGGLIEDRNNAHRICTRTESEADLNVFTEGRGNVKRAVKVAERNCEGGVAGSCKEDPKRFCECVN